MVKFKLNLCCDFMPEFTKRKTEYKELYSEFIESETSYGEACIKLNSDTFKYLLRRYSLLEDIILNGVIDESAFTALTWLGDNDYIYYKDGDKIKSLNPYLVFNENEDGIEFLLIDEGRNKDILNVKYVNRVVSKKLKILSKKRIIKLREEDSEFLPNMSGWGIEKSLVINSARNINIHYVNDTYIDNTYDSTILIEQNGILIALDAIIKVPYLLEGMFGIRHELLYTKMVELIGRKHKLVTWL